MSLALRQFMADIWQRLGMQIPLMLLWLCLTAGLGAISIAAMLPLLNAVGIGGQSSGIAAVVGQVMLLVQQKLGLPPGASGYVLLLLALLLLNYLFFLLHAWWASRLQMRYVAERQVELFDAILAAEWRFFREHRSGDLLNTLITEMQRLNAAFYHAALLMAALVHIGVYVVAAFLVSWPVTLAILFSGMLLIAISLPWIRRGRRMGLAITTNNADLQSSAGQFVGLAKLIKATATEPAASRSFSGIVGRLEMLNHWVSFDGQIVRALFELISTLLLIGILVIGPMLAGVDAGVILVVVGLFARLFPRLSGLQQSLQAISTVLPALEAVNALLKVAQARREADSAASSGVLPFTAGEPVSVSCRDLTLAYGDMRVLDGLSLDIAAGECVAVVGASGAGKSTFLDCLLRLAEPSAGKIEIQGHDLAALPLRVWRGAVGYMGQDSAILNASVRDNLCWGNTALDNAALEQVARQVEARELIARMPQGLDTMLGDRGRALSGGERQRLALARALARRPGLLILDEATSALDANTETRIIETLQHLKGKVTLILVAHRLATVRVADRICVLEAGRVVESGSFNALLSGDTRFSRLWAMQTNENEALTAIPLPGNA